MKRLDAKDTIIAQKDSCIKELETAVESFKAGMMDAQDKACLGHIEELEKANARIHSLKDGLKKAMEALQVIASGDCIDCHADKRAEEALTTLNSLIEGSK